MDGAHEYLEAGAVPGPEAIPLGLPSLDEGLDAEVVAVDGNFPYRYCSEYLVAAPEGGALDLGLLRESLPSSGDSLIVAGTTRRARIHIHTDAPASVMEEVSRQGWILEQKVDDMRRQYEDAHAPHGRIALVTDSTCDLPRDFLDAHGVHVVPLFIRFGEREYLDRLTLDPDRFYDLADAAPVFPSSSQPSRPALERLYRSLLSHYEAVVSIHVAAALSGTVEAARAAASSFPLGRVRVVDSRHLSGSLGLLVLRAAEYLEAAESGEAPAPSAAIADALVAALSAWSDRAENLVSVRTLSFMVRGGRVSPLGGFLAKALNLKPIVSVDHDGRSRLYGASLSAGANLKRIMRMIEARHARAPLRSWAVVHAHAAPEAQALAGRLEARLGIPPLYVSEISAVVGMNAGRGALSVVAMSE
jgi:DegV family protein with EDD domain